MINGRSVPILGAASAPLTPRPILGRVRAKVVYPLTAPPTVSGPAGRAWLCDLEAARRRMFERASWPAGAPASVPNVTPDATVAHWIIEAPWSHEVVHSYSLVLIHLRYMNASAVTRYLEGATHELTLYPIHPAAPRVQMLDGPINPTMWLEPIAFASQIIEPTDEAAAARIKRAAELVCEGRISPHPDHGKAWVELFGDCMLKHAVPPVQEEADE